MLVGPGFHEGLKKGNSREGHAVAWRSWWDRRVEIQEDYSPTCLSSSDALLLLNGLAHLTGVQTFIARIVVCRDNEEVGAPSV